MLLLLFQIFGIPAAAIALAVAIARYTAKKAIDQRFDAATQNLKHNHDRAIEEIRWTNSRDIERLKGELNTGLDRITKLHNFEYETIPEAWRLMHVALGDVVGALKRGLIEMPDVKSMPQDRVEAFVENLPWDDVFKKELLKAEDKQALYSKYDDQYRLVQGRRSQAAFHNYLIERGIFIHPDLLEDLRVFANDMSSVLIEQKIKLEIRGSGSLSYLSADQINEMNAKGDAFMNAYSNTVKALEIKVQGRLWTIRIS